MDIDRIWNLIDATNENEGAIPGAVPLAKSLVERGLILKSPIYEDSDCSVAMLTLFPGAKIREHWHISDKEYYFFIKEKRIECCKIGESHQLENLTGEVLFVIAVKYKL